MEQFLTQATAFGKDMLFYALVALFLENTVFSRSIGVSTGLFVMRKGWPKLRFGLILTLMMTLASLVCFLVRPLLRRMPAADFLLPAFYVVCIGLLYVLALFVCRSVFHNRDAALTMQIHVAAFNCAVLGTVLLLHTASELSLAGFLGFGIGTGLGFLLAVCILSAAWDRLTSDDIPAPFRGLPITLIYIGIVSLALYGLIGHELPF